jgi:hypothetical protein
MAFDRGLGVWVNFEHIYVAMKFDALPPLRGDGEYGEWDASREAIYLLAKAVQRVAARLDLDADEIIPPDKCHVETTSVVNDKLVHKTRAGPYPAAPHFDAAAHFKFFG